jgi:hypothetical protein
MFAVFNMTVGPPYETLDMFETPGLIGSIDRVDQWCQDLVKNGVMVGFDGSRSPVCPYDATNLIWSGKALLNSCTPTLKESILLKLGKDISNADNPRYGPMVLVTLLNIIYRPSYAQIEKLGEQLKALKITDYPAEDVTLYAKAATMIIRKIQMTCIERRQYPNVASHALRGLTLGSDQAFTIHMVNTVSKLNANPHSDPLEALEAAQTFYRTLLDEDLYGPAKEVKKQAQLAAYNALVEKAAKQAASQVSQSLGQQRGAASTHGNGKSQSNRPKGECWTCGSKTHFKGHPDCPGPSAAQSESNSDSSSSRPNRHGLDSDTVKKIKSIAAEAKAKLPSGTDFADGTEFKDESGKVVGTYCSKCQRPTYGQTMHSFATGHGNSTQANLGATPAPAPAPTPAPAPAPAPVPHLQAAPAFTPQPGTMFALVADDSTPVSPIAGPPLQAAPADYCFGPESITPDSDLDKLVGCNNM